MNDGLAMLIGMVIGVGSGLALGRWLFVRSMRKDPWW